MWVLVLSSFIAVNENSIFSMSLLNSIKKSRFSSSASIYYDVVMSLLVDSSWVSISSGSFGSGSSSAF
jgi:threonine synthase